MLSRELRSPRSHDASWQMLAEVFLPDLKVTDHAAAQLAAA
jgi:hypothetical protein